MQQIKSLILSIILVGCCGCSIFMPYESEFKCPKTYGGKCVTMEEAYNESLTGTGVTHVEMEEEKTRKSKRKNNSGNTSVEPPKPITPDNKNIYRDNLYLELAGLLKDPVTPVVVPPKIVRALIFPYPDGKELFMPRYTYMMVDEPTWVVDTYLLGKSKE